MASHLASRTAGGRSQRGNVRSRYRGQRAGKRRAVALASRNHRLHTAIGKVIEKTSDRAPSLAACAVRTAANTATRLVSEDLISEAELGLGASKLARGGARGARSLPDLVRRLAGQSGVQVARLSARKRSMSTLNFGQPGPAAPAARYGPGLYPRSPLQVMASGVVTPRRSSSIFHRQSAAGSWTSW